MAKKRIIAVDVDDVLLDSAWHIINYYNETHGTDIQLQDMYSRDTTVWGVSDIDIAIRRVDVYLTSEAYTNLAPMPEAVRAISRLSSAHELHVVTGRGDFIAEPTRQWLRRHFADAFQTVEFTNFIRPSDGQVKSRPKADVCSQIGADMLIDDHLHHAQAVAAAGMGVILLDRPWNQSETLPTGVTRVGSWPEIEALLLSGVS